MDNGFSVLMFIFSGLILLYAAIMAITKDYNMLPFRARVSVKPKNPKAYAFQLSKVIALVAVVPALAGLAAYVHALLAVAVFVLGLVVTLWIGTKWMKDFF